MHNINLIPLNEQPNANTVVIVLQTASGSIIPYMPIVNSLIGLCSIFGLSFQLPSGGYLNKNQVDNFFLECAKAISQIKIDNIFLLGWSFSGVVACHLTGLLSSRQCQYSAIAMDCVNLIEDVFSGEHKKQRTSEQITKHYLEETRYLMQQSESADVAHKMYDLKTVDDFIAVMVVNKDPDEVDAISSYILSRYQQYTNNIKMLYTEVTPLNYTKLHHIIGRDSIQENKEYVINNTNCESISVEEVDANHYEILNHIKTHELIKKIVSNCVRDNKYNMEII